MDPRILSSLVDSHHCKLVLIGKYYMDSTKMVGWVPFAYWDDLYTKLMTGGHFTNYYTKETYDFGLYLNLRDDGGAGLGYAKEEMQDERCILRAMFLATRGNVLFGDWGWPAECPPETTHEELRRKCVEPAYVYASVASRWYPREGRYTVNRPLLLFLDHFLQPIEAKEKSLSDETIQRIVRGVEGTLFSGATTSGVLECIF
jgi:hypothetical protein